MGKSGIQKAAIFDDDASSATYGTVVQFNHVQDDGTFETNGQGTLMASGIELLGGEESIVELGFAAESGITQLRDWMEADKPLKLVLAGLQFNGLWYEAEPMRLVDPKGFTAGDRTWRRLLLDSDKVSPDIFRGINLLEGVSGTTVLFPISGITVTASADGGTTNLVIEALDKDDVQLATDSVAPASRASVSLELPANTYKVTITPPSGATDLALRTDGEDEYIAG